MNQRKRITRHVLAAFASALAVSAESPAATFTWSGGNSSGYFGYANNWLSGTAPPTSGADLIFGANHSNTAPFANTSYGVNSITFNSSAYSFTGGQNLEGNALTIGAGGITDSAANSEAISDSVFLGANQTWNFSGGNYLGNGTLNLSGYALTTNVSSGTTTLSGALSTSGTSGLTKTGTGTLAISGGGTIGSLLANVGSTTVTANTLTLTSTGTAVSLGSSTGSNNLTVGSTLVESGAGASTAIGFTTNGTDLLTVSAGGVFNSGTGATTINPSGYLAVTGGSYIANGGLSGSGSITLSDPTGGTALTINGVNDTTSTSTALIGGTGSLTVSGSGKEVLAGVNTFTGNVTVSSAQLEMANNGAIATSSYTVSGTGVSTGQTGVLVMDSGSVGGTVTINNYGVATGAASYVSVKLNAGGVFLPGTASVPYIPSISAPDVNSARIQPIVAGTVSSTGRITIGAPTTVTVPNSSDVFTLTGEITTAGSNSYGVTRTGAGTFNLTGQLDCSTFSVQAGQTTISGSHPSSLSGSGIALTVTGGAALNISQGAMLQTPNDTGDLIGGAAGTGVTVTGASSSLSVNSLTVGGGSQGSLTVTTSGSLTVANQLLIGGGVGGSGGLSVGSGGKVTAGSLSIGANTSYGSVSVDGSGSSMIITNGLTVGGSSSSNTASIAITGGGDVSAGSSLSLTGPYSSINVSGSSSSLVAGGLSSSAGGSIALNGSSTSLTINGTIGGTYYGSISGTGGLTLAGSTTQFLDGTNTYTGSTVVEYGHLEMGSGASYYYQVNTGSTLQLDFPDLGSSVVYAASGTTVTYGGPVISGGFIDGLGTQNIAAVGTISGTTLENGVTITPANLTYLRAVSNSGTIVNSASTTTFWFGGSNAGGTLDVSGTVLLNAWTSSGIVQVNAGGAIDNQYGTNMVLLAGSRTYVGSANAPGGSISLNSGGTLELNGGLLVNYGTISGAAVDVNYGGLATGTGTYGTVVVNAGGTYLPGNYTPSSPVPPLGSPNALIEPAASGATTTGTSISANGSVVITVNNTDSLTLSSSLITNGNSVTKTGTGTVVLPAFQTASLNVSSGTVRISPGTGPLASGALAISSGATLDLTNNCADISSTSLATINSLVQQGFNGGSWNGSGITSSSAAADPKHLTAIGVIQNNQDGSPVYTGSNPFQGIAPNATDVLLAYTYYGDANLDGRVDGSDYTLVDNGFNNHLTGWLNGDFNYDGKVDGSDYTLIDNAFNTQGATLAAIIASSSAQFSGSSAVPEPASFVVALAGLGLLRRRREPRRK